MCNSVLSIRNTSLYCSQTSSVVFACKTSWLASELLVSIGSSPHVFFSMQNSDFWIEITSLYVSQTSPVVFCMHYSVISTRNTFLYGSQHLSLAFVCKTATFGAELQVSMCTKPHLSFCACKTARIASESLASMGPSPHLLFFHAKQRLLDQNNKSLWVPDITCLFVPAKQRD